MKRDPRCSAYDEDRKIGSGMSTLVIRAAWRAGAARVRAELVFLCPEVRRQIMTSDFISDVNLQGIVDHIHVLTFSSTARIFSVKNEVRVCLSLYSDLQDKNPFHILPSISY